MKRILLATLACGAMAVFGGTASADHGFPGRTNYAAPYGNGGFVGIGSQNYGPNGWQSTSGACGCRAACGPNGCSSCRGTTYYRGGLGGFQQSYLSPRFDRYGRRYVPRYR